MDKKMDKKPVGLELLRAPFPDHQISLLPKPTKKENPKGKCQECGGYHGLPAVHLEYVGHAALTDRLLDSDPNWTWEPLALKEGLPAFDESGGLWIRLTVCGVTRLGYGNAQDSTFKEVGSREKEVIGDALRNAAMRFGAALELWHKGELHIDSEDRPVAPPAAQGRAQPPIPSPLPQGRPTAPAIPNVAPKASTVNLLATWIKTGTDRKWTLEGLEELMALETGKSHSKDLSSDEIQKLTEFVTKHGPGIMGPGYAVPRGV